MSDSQKTIDRIRTLLQRTESNGASEAEENTAARMVCKMLRQFPELLCQAPTTLDIELERHSAAAYARHWSPPEGFNNNTASGTGDIDELRDFVAGLHKPPGYVIVRYNKFIRQNSTEVLLLVNTIDGWEELWLPLNKLKMKTRVIWIEANTASEYRLRTMK